MYKRYIFIKIKKSLVAGTTKDLTQMYVPNYIHYNTEGDYNGSFKD